MIDTKVETPSATSAASASLKILAAVVVITCIHVASSILIPLVCALFLAFILDPGVVLLERARLPRWLASLIMVLLTLALVYLLGYLAYDRIMAFIDVLPRVAAGSPMMFTSVLSPPLMRPLNGCGTGTGDTGPGGWIR